jgi:hypothetical protein
MPGLNVYYADHLIRALVVLGYAVQVEGGPEELADFVELDELGNWVGLEEPGDEVVLGVRQVPVGGDGSRLRSCHVSEVLGLKLGEYYAHQ